MSDLTVISLDRVKSWVQASGGPRTPAQIAAACPHCAMWCIFSASSTQVNTNTGIGSSKSKCPSCDEFLGFIYIYPDKIRPNATQTSILLFPAPKLKRPEAFEAEGVPQDVSKAFRNTLDTFQSRNYTATTVMGRRTLEGLLLSLLPPDHEKQNLHRLIEAVTKEVDFAKPLNQLSHAIRASGNLGAHFDPAAEPDEVMAQQLVELLDYLISYLFVLPTKIKQLEDAIEQGRVTSAKWQRLIS